MQQVIELLIVACLTANPNACSEIRTQTDFTSVVQCNLMAQLPIIEIMQHHPKRRVARYSCRVVTMGSEA